MPQRVEAKPPDHQQRLHYDVTAHLRLAHPAILKRDGDLDDAQSALMATVRNLDLERITGGMDGTEIQGLQRPASEPLKA